MLSLTKGREIATFQEGEMKGKPIRLFGKDDFSVKTRPHLKVPKEQRGELLGRDFYKQNSVSPAKKQTLLSIVNGKRDSGDLSAEMSELVEEADAYINNSLKTKIDFDDKYTKLFPIPQKFSERIYVPAPSGSGKSTFIGMYIEQLTKKFGKNRKIFIFSRVEKDEPLDKFGKRVVRIPLEQSYFDDNPLQIEHFKKSIIVFDDIDTLLNKQLVKYIRAFRDDILETGRHYDISIISTSHLIANFLATRTLINEANAIVLFPRGSSFYAVSNFLERYLGFTKEQIRYVERLPTRWIFFWKEYPKYAIHEKGAFLY